jgi:DNA-binding PucR family transcriptional regulator
VRVGEFLARPAGRLMPAAAAGRQAAPGRAATDVKEVSPVTVSPVTASPVPEPPLHELLLASVPVPVLRSSRERLLGPVREYDTRHNADLLPTLRSFLACDGSWSACASRMYVHVNTVRYRISRIEALTGRDLSALADRVDFFLALRG